MKSRKSEARARIVEYALTALLLTVALVSALEVLLPG